jgi:hypothetical protein
MRSLMMAVTLSRMGTGKNCGQLDGGDHVRPHRRRKRNRSGSAEGLWNDALQKWPTLMMIDLSQIKTDEQLGVKFEER